MPIQDRSSRAAACLEQAWRELRARHRRIPPAVLLVLSAGDRKGSKLGHFSASSWKYNRALRAHEIAVSPALFASPEDLLATLLHEAAHAILHSDHGGVSGRYYHLATFRDVCQQLGLECQFKNTRYGWTITGWPAEGVPSIYDPALRVLRTLPPGTEVLRPDDRASPLPKSGWVRLACRCIPERAVYTARSVASDGGVECAICGCAFFV